MKLFKTPIIIIEIIITLFILSKTGFIQASGCACDSDTVTVYFDIGGAMLTNSNLQNLTPSCSPGNPFIGIPQFLNNTTGANGEISILFRLNTTETECASQIVPYHNQNFALFRDAFGTIMKGNLTDGTPSIPYLGAPAVCTSPNTIINTKFAVVVPKYDGCNITFRLRVCGYGCVSAGSPNLIQWLKQTSLQETSTGRINGETISLGYIDFENIWPTTDCSYLYCN
jgi:hypothetical protein